MKVLIIEDEILTANDLADTLKSLSPDIRVVGVLHSIEESLDWFQKHPLPDLIFSDIQLGDGLSFELFSKAKVQVPVIFCTAYDEYALKAFGANGIEYLLKPFSEEDIANALIKFKRLQGEGSIRPHNYESIIFSYNEQRDQRIGSILVHYKDKILPIRIQDIALFYIEHENVYLMTFSQEQYPVTKKLDELEQLCGRSFFRINRQALVHRKAIKEASQYFARKLSLKLNIPFSSQLIVSKERVRDFLDWLASS